MANGCKKKQVTKSTARTNANILRTMRNKEAKLVSQLKANPSDISAANALGQVRYDLKNYRPKA